MTSPEHPPVGTTRPVRLPVIGAIDEPTLETTGWRVVRDPKTGLALHEEYVGTGTDEQIRETTD